MKWVVLGMLVASIVFGVLAFLTDNSRDPDVRSSAPIPWLISLALLGGAVVLAIGYTILKALLT